MNTKEYNGWTNYETWLVKLWMDNDEGSQNHWKEKAEQIWKDTDHDQHFTKSERAALILAGTLKDEHEAHYLEALRHAKQECSWMSDMLGAAMSEVDWREIAASLLEDHCEDYSKEEKEASHAN